jgi:predicted DNA binding CopG/RHH family protein
MNSLDQEEKEILEAFEADAVKQVGNVERELENHKAIAEATFKKDARINIRLSSRDLRAIQAQALAEGMPYQTLISSILHKFAEGRLIDSVANREAGGL